MSWNQGVWGYGNESVEAVELVTAEAKLITANERDHSDYFWAARGAGYGFFGVVTRYLLKLYPLPKAIHGVTYYYSLNDAPTVAETTSPQTCWLPSKVAGCLLTSRFPCIPAGSVTCGANNDNDNGSRYIPQRARTIDASPGFPQGP